MTINTSPTQDKMPGLALPLPDRLPSAPPSQVRRLGPRISSSPTPPIKPSPPAKPHGQACCSRTPVPPEHPSTTMTPSWDPRTPFRSTRVIAAVPQTHSAAPNIPTTPARPSASPSHMQLTLPSATSPADEVGTPSRSCPRRRMPSVSGQTSLMRLRTALATTPTPRTSDKAPLLLTGKENAETKAPATPLRVRPARAPLRTLERSDPSSPTSRMELCSATVPRSRKRKVYEDDEGDEGSPSKRAKLRATLEPPKAPLRRHLFNADVDGNGGYRLTEFEQATSVAEQCSRSSTRRTSKSVVGKLPEFPTEYFFGELGEALVDLAPFMGMGVGVGGQKRRGSVDVERTAVKRLRKEDEVESEVADAGGDELVRDWVEGLPSPRARRG